MSSNIENLQRLYEKQEECIALVLWVNDVACHIAWYDAAGSSQLALMGFIGQQ
jgi:hypothetical protein